VALASGVFVGAAVELSAVDVIGATGVAGLGVKVITCSRIVAVAASVGAFN